MFTGKGTGWGGAEVRTEATGYGAVFFAQEMLAVHNDSLTGKRVASRARATSRSTRSRRPPSSARPPSRPPTRPATSSTTPASTSTCSVSSRRSSAPASSSTPTVVRARASSEGGSVWEVPVDIAVPSATQNEVSLADAEALIANGVRAVSEGANMPCVPDAVEAFQKAGVLFAPGKAANAGGVATSRSR